MLSIDDLVELVEAARATVFRMETRDRYEVASDGSDYRRYLDGLAEPDWSTKQYWLDALRAEHEAGRRRCRVHVIDTTHGLGDYLAYECEWGYAYNTQAGEDIRILDLAEHTRPGELDRAPGDWWLLDDQHVALMHYDQTGQFRGAALAAGHDLPHYQRAAAAAWRCAADFDTWWQAHPQFHRDRRAA